MVMNSEIRKRLPSLSSDEVTEDLTEVGQLKDKQEEMDGRLDVMKNENEALWWREVITLGLRYSQHQETVNKEAYSQDRDDEQGQAQAMAMMDTKGQKEETQVLAI